MRMFGKPGSAWRRPLLVIRSSQSLVRLSAMLLFCLFITACGEPGPLTKTAPAVAFNAELAYLQELNSAAPVENPQVAVLLMMEYQISGRQAEGSAFFEQLLHLHAGSMSPSQELVYLSSLGILRAEAAEDVPLIGRIGWVNDTIEILERARAIGDNKVFFSRFAAALVYSRLPSMFGKEDQAFEDFAWLVENRAKAFQPGQMRLIYQSYARSLRKVGRDDEARALLADAGLVARESDLVTNFAVNPQRGATFRPRRFVEIAPGQIYLISGLNFTEYYFIISDDRKNLISIDAGVTPDGAEAAYELLRANVADLPPLTTVFVTHAHWDHIGGHGFFRRLNPDVVFYGRANYAEELSIMAAGPGDQANWFFGSLYDNSLIMDYSPDVPISAEQTVTIGGTDFTLLPAPGAETPDAMFVHMPDQRVLFVGDFIMPYSGAPFFEEGSVDALVDGIDVIAQLDPAEIWHGHEPLTANWSSPDRLTAMKPHLAWLRDAVRSRIRKGTARDAIHRENLIPPSLFADPEAQVFFLSMREQIINRLYDQSIGYWGPELTGLDHLGTADYGNALSRYFDLEVEQVENAVESMLAAGDLHLAERVVRWALKGWPNAQRLRDLQKRAAIGLRDKYQLYNPFKFFLYSTLADTPTPQLYAQDSPVEAD